MRDDLRAGLGHELIRARVIAVIMRVQHPADGFITDALDGRLDLGCQRRELIIDKQHTVFTYGNADVAAGPAQHVNGPGNLLHLDLDLGKITLLGECAYSQSEQHQQQFLHWSSWNKAAIF